MSNREEGTSLVSLLVGMGLSAMVVAAAFHGIVSVGRSLRHSISQADRHLEIARAGDFVASLGSWAGTGASGEASFLSRSPSAIAFGVRSPANGSHFVICLARSGEALTSQRDSGYRWTIVKGLPDEPFDVGTSGFTRIPLDLGIAVVLPGEPAGSFPAAWGAP